MASTYPPRVTTVTVPRPPGTRGFLRRAFAANAPLALAGIALIFVLVVALVGLVVDPQSITGAPAWLKPAKFAISFAVYAFTLLYLLTYVRGHRRLVGLVSIVTAAGLVLEMGIIALQAARGTTSHFNFSTPLDATLFSIMGGIIVHVWLAGALTVLLLLFQRLPDPAFAWALRLGLLVSLAGMAVGGLMLRATPAQTTARAAGHVVPIVGAHSVGVPDGGPGLPILGWSTVGGDLRAPHFIGLHALQVVLLVGWLLMRQSSRISSGHRVALVWTAALSYLGLVLLLLWQALRGQSVVAPDGATLTGAAILATGTMVAVGAILLHASRFGVVKNEDAPRSGGYSLPRPRQ